MIEWANEFLFGTPRVKTFVVVTGGRLIRSAVWTVNSNVDFNGLCLEIERSNIVAKNEQLNGIYYVLPSGERVSITRHNTNIRSILYYRSLNIYLDVSYAS